MLKVLGSGRWLVLVLGCGVILGSGCADDASSSDPFAGLTHAFARGSSFSFYADDPGVWESSDPAVARIMEADARRARVRFDGTGSSRLTFFGVDDATHEARVRVRDVASLIALPDEPLDGTRVLAGGSVRVPIIFRDGDGEPLFGADLLDDPGHQALTRQLPLMEDALVLSPTLAESGDVPLTVGGETLGRLRWEAVASESVQIILSIATVGDDCQILAELVSGGAPVVGWWGQLRWDHKPLWLDGRAPCAPVGQRVTVTLGAASASITR
jgi:hypothetical protein